MFSLCSSCVGTALNSLSQPIVCASSAHALRRTCHSELCSLMQASCKAVTSPVTMFYVMLLSMLMAPGMLPAASSCLHVNENVMPLRMTDLTSFVLSSFKTSVLEFGWASNTS